METALYPFFYLTARAAESAEEYITDGQLVFIIDEKTPLNAAGGRCDFKQGDVFLLKNKQYISYQETLDKFKIYSDILKIKYSEKIEKYSKQLKKEMNT
jgi:hypothetical protein